jgi:CTP:molybdopterin cytidylyltransferase MocA
MTVSPAIGGVLLAAGGGSRFAGSEQGHKLTATLRGRPVVEWSLEQLLRAGFDDVVVVTGAVELHVPDGVVALHNPRWAEGQATSLALAIDRARQRELEAVVVGLADQPFVLAEAWRAVAAAPGAIAVATYDGRRGNPVKLDASVWDLLPVEGDAGARVVMGMRPELVTEVACAGSPADIDTPEDLRRWNSPTTSP